MSVQERQTSIQVCQQNCVTAWGKHRGGYGGDRRCKHQPARILPPLPQVSRFLGFHLIWHLFRAHASCLSGLSCPAIHQSPQGIAKTAYVAHFPTRHWTCTAPGQYHCRRIWEFVLLPAAADEFAPVVAQPVGDWGWVAAGAVPAVCA